MTLSGVSVGGVSCLENGGSFGGFLIDNVGALHGMTARHCVPRMRTGDPVSPPASLEFTARFEYIVPYTGISRRTFRDLQPKIGGSGTVNQYRLADNPNGVQCMIEGNLRSAMLEGPRVGVLERAVFRDEAGLRAARLEEVNQQPFLGCTSDDVSRLDYAIYTIESK
jgi:hypothetical protein